MDETSLDQRQSDKQIQSEWMQTNERVTHDITCHEGLLDRKIEDQKHENQHLLKQLIDLKKQHNILHSQVSVCRAKVQELRNLVG